MKKIIIPLIFLLGLFHQSYSQTLADVLRYSFYNPGGSARYMGVGGAMGAMGADYGAISVNPAGLGAYWTSEFVFSPSILSATTNSIFNGGINNGRNIASLKMDNFGMIMNKTPHKGALKSFNTAIGVNRIADFTQEFYYEGKTSGTIVERFLQRANGKDLDRLDLFEADLAYATGAIYDPDENNTYVSDFSDYQSAELLDFDVNKAQDVDYSGGINEVLFGFGANISNKLLIGATVGVPILNFESIKVYNESDPNDEIPYFTALEYTEYLNTSGVGFNVKAGLIFKLTNDIQLGGSLSSPTYYNLTDNYYTALTYSFIEDGAQELSETSPDGSFRYRMQTPWRAMASFGIKKKIGSVGGFINGDVEWVDYRNGSLDLSVYSSSQEDAILGNDINQQIESQLLSALNIRLGGEVAINKFRLRAGYNLIGSPYGADSGVFFPGYSFGFGFRETKYYVDLGYRFTEVNEGYIPYVTLDDERLQLVENEVRNGKLVMTVGFQF